jgi:predicted transcriptional regulator
LYQSRRGQTNAFPSGRTRVRACRIERPLTRSERRAIIEVMPLIETEEAARRLARAIASDLSLYNEDKIVGGIQNDNLFESLAEEIEEGRALYKRRVSPELYPRNFYDRALVDILVKAKGHIKSKLW